MFVMEFKTPTGIFCPPATYNMERFTAFGEAVPYSIFSESLRDSSISCPSLLAVRMLVSEEISEEFREFTTCIMAELAIL
jgi:hypothetical protein